MLSPKRVKFRKRFKGRTTGLAHRGSEISFGTYGLQTLEPGWITARQIEAARVALTRHIKRGGKVWVRIFPDKPITIPGRAVYTSTRRRSRVRSISTRLTAARSSWRFR